MTKQEETKVETEFKMRVAIVQLESAAPYGQSRAISSKKRDNEPNDEFEERTWRERMHVDDKGFVFIPPTALKNCLSDSAKFLSMSVPGKGKATYTKHFEAGLSVTDPIEIGVKASDIVPVRLYVPSDGRRGGSKRVWRTFPCVPKWKGVATILVLDETITPAVLEKHLKAAGRFIGMGMFRPRNNGFWGRFTIGDIEWQDLT